MPNPFAPPLFNVHDDDLSPDFLPLEIFHVVGDDDDDDDDDSDDDEDANDGDGDGDDDDDAVEEVDAITVAQPRVSVTHETELDSQITVAPHHSTSREGEGESAGTPKEWNREDIDGLFCPICMEPWTSSGQHQPSCLTCGHLFGMSCIKKWLAQRRNSGKCPQCNKRCTLKDIRRIYGTRVVVVDEESQKKIQYLEAKCDSLAKKDEEWSKKEVEWHMKMLVFQKREEELSQNLLRLNERASNLERAVGELENKSNAANDGLEEIPAGGLKVGLTYSSPSSCKFELQHECSLDGARYFDVDDTGQILLIARRPANIGGPHFLTKMSIVSPHEQDTVLLPSSVKAIRDLHLCRLQRLALLASMGKKLSVLSMDSNNIVLSYELPAAAWSCSWDSNSSQYVYAGLQNGMLLVFDLRQTQRPLESRNGLTNNLIHTIYSQSEDSPLHTGVKKLFTASSVGLCEWSIGGEYKEPSLISETADQGVCISVAHCPSSDNIVATFRPKVEIPNNDGISQVSQSVSSSVDYPVQGSHVFMQRVNSTYQRFGATIASVPGIRLPKSSIIGMGDGTPLFACGDEGMSNVVLQELPTLSIFQRLQSHHPIRDVKYTTSTKSSQICCLSEDRMQFFTQKLL